MSEVARFLPPNLGSFKRVILLELEVAALHILIISRREVSFMLSNHVIHSIFSADRRLKLTKHPTLNLINLCINVIVYYVIYASYVRRLKR